MTVGGHEDHWVFGYGSLMWRPGFDYIRSAPAVLSGYHRALCVYSHVHRGTPEKPGLVFGLDRGGSCTGIAFQVAPENWHATATYLREREQATAVYLERYQQITLQQDHPKTVTALTFLVDTSHRQYAGKLSHTEQLHFIHHGHGQSGPCNEYVLASARHLSELGVHDPEIQALAKALTQPKKAAELIPGSRPG